MTTEQLFEKIREWESDHGESFVDYFMHGNVKDNSWAFWLLGKGYTEKANEIIVELLKGETCLDQELLYEIYPEYDENDKWNEDNYNKSVMLWAEFLLSTPFYSDKVNKFLTKETY